MALLASRTFDTVAGTSNLSFVGSGITLFRIVEVKREGIQYDKVLNANLNNGVQRQWALDVFNQRIKFPTSVPFNTGEKVFVVYKLTAI